MKLKRTLAYFAAGLILLASGCAFQGAETAQAPQETTVQTPVETEAESKEPESPEESMTIALLKGPTGIGGAKIMADAESEKLPYTFILCATPDEAAAKIISGEADIAAVPTNLASVLFQKTEGKVQVAALNTLGVLSVLEKGDTIHSMADLSGQTIYVSGQGATPEYVVNYLLNKNKVTDAVISFKAEHAELAAIMASGEIGLCVLPEPNVTAVLSKNPDVRIALDLTAEWNRVLAGTDAEGSQLTMGCLVVQKDFAERHKETFDQFLEDYEASITFAAEDPAAASLLVEQAGIMPAASVAEKAIPNCNLVYIDGEEMEKGLSGFLEVLFEANPASVGGALPDETFYYQK